MKTKFLNRFRNIAQVIFALCVVSMTFISACKKDDPKKDQHFTVENMPSELKVSSNSTTQSYVVNSNSSWEVVAKGNGDWAKVDPELYKGEGSGAFKIVINENTTSEVRSMEFAFMVNGQQQPTLLKVTQEAFVEDAIDPIFIVADIATGKSINHTAQDVKLTVETNIEYTYISDADWLVFDKKETNGTIDELTFKASANEGSTIRPARITFTCPEFPELNGTFIIAQEGKPAPSQILKEDFNWLTAGSTIFYVTTAEKRLDVWTEEELAKGWTSTVNPIEGSGNQKLVYGRPGFVKLGKTSYGGDLISPKLAAVVGTQNLLVKFKAVPYKTLGGTMDGTILKINIIGPGTISESQFNIDNWPDYTGADNSNCDACTSIWQANGTERSFTITGATAETQIRFLGQDFDLTTASPNKNRIFLDDIEVTTIVD